jgi:hypothetical protein
MRTVNGCGRCTQNDNLELECGPPIAYGEQQNYHRKVFPASVLSQVTRSVCSSSPSH